jgi:Cdc6-like AAA superfamily ATPase
VSEKPFLSPSRQGDDNQRLIAFVALVSALLTVGPLAVTSTAFTVRYLKMNRAWRRLLLVCVAGVVSIVYTGLTWPSAQAWYMTTVRRVVDDIVPREVRVESREHPQWTAHVVSFTLLWLWAVPLSPSLALFWRLWEYLTKERSLWQQLEDEERLQKRHEERLARQAETRSHLLPDGAQGIIRIGAKIKGDDPPQALGIVRQGQFVGVPEWVLDQHLFILGAPGAGKSETIKRFVAEVLAHTERDVYLVDGKGEEQLANEVQSLVWHYRGYDPPIFRLGQSTHGSMYNGFSGDREAIWNRLAAMVGVGEAEGNAQFYADMNRSLLQFVCYVAEGPPRSFDDVRERLNLPWLRQAWQKYPAIQRRLLQLKERDIQGLEWRLSPLMMEFRTLVGKEGFTLEDTHAAIFSIRTQSVGDTASRFVQFLIEDLKDFAGKRQQRPAILIIDEFAAFGNENIVALLALARSARLSIVLATQDVAGLGEENIRNLILANTRTKFLMATDRPEEIATLAGTVFQVETSVQHEEGVATGMGSARPQHTFKVDPNEVARLLPGQGFLIRQRYAVKVQVSRVEGIPPAPQEAPRGPLLVEEEKEPELPPEAPKKDTQEPEEPFIDP